PDTPAGPVPVLPRLARSYIWRTARAVPGHPASAPIPARFHPRMRHHSQDDTPPAPRTGRRESAHSSFASVPFRDGCDDSDGCLGGSIFTVATVATVAPILNY